MANKCKWCFDHNTVCIHSNTDKKYCFCQEPPFDDSNSFLFDAIEELFEYPIVKRYMERIDIEKLYFNKSLVYNYYVLFAQTNIDKEWHIPVGIVFYDNGSDVSIFKNDLPK